MQALDHSPWGAKTRKYYQAHAAALMRLGEQDGDLDKFSAASPNALVRGAKLVQVAESCSPRRINAAA